MNEDLMRENRVPHTEAMKYFTRVGLAVLLMFVARKIVVLLTVNILELAAPVFLDLVRDGTYWWFNWLLSVIPLYCVGLPVYLLVLPKKAVPVGEKKRLGVGRFVSVCFSTAAGIYVFNIAGVLLLTFLSLISGGVVGGIESDSLNQMINSSPVWMIFIVTCIVVPIGEEIIFRKLLIDRVKPFGELNACLFSGLIFGLFHANLRQFLYAFAIGFIFATVYIKTNNIIYSILLHFGVNLFGTVISPQLLNPERINQLKEVIMNTTEFTPEIALALLYLLFVAALGFVVLGAVIAGIVLFIFYMKKLKFDPPVLISERDNSEFWKNPGVIASIVVLSCVIVRELINLPK